MKKILLVEDDQAAFQKGHHFTVCLGVSVPVSNRFVDWSD